MSLRVQVLGAYRKLLRARQLIFLGDNEALTQSRTKIRESFLANASVADPDDIVAHVQCAEETADFLLQGVVQGELDTTKDTYKVKISEHTHLHENVPLKETNKVDLSNFTVPERFKRKS